MKFHILSICFATCTITVASPTPQLVVDLDACAKQQGKPRPMSCFPLYRFGASEAFILTATDPYLGNTCDPEVGCGCAGLFCDTSIGPKGFGICISPIIPPMLPPLPDEPETKPAAPTKAWSGGIRLSSCDSSAGQSYGNGKDEYISVCTWHSLHICGRGSFHNGILSNMCLQSRMYFFFFFQTSLLWCVIVSLSSVLN